MEKLGIGRRKRKRGNIRPKKPKCTLTLLLPIRPLVSPRLYCTYASINTGPLAPTESQRRSADRTLKSSLELRNKTSLSPNFPLLLSSQHGPLPFPGSPGFGRPPAGRGDLEEVGPQPPEGIPAGAAQVIEKGKKRRAILGGSPFPFLAYGHAKQMQSCSIIFSGFLFYTHCWSSISRRNQVWLFCNVFIQVIVPFPPFLSQPAPAWLPPLRVRRRPPALPLPRLPLLGGEVRQGGGLPRGQDAGCPRLRLLCAARGASLGRRILQAAHLPVQPGKGRPPGAKPGGEGTGDPAITGEEKPSPNK